MKKTYILLSCVKAEKRRLRLELCVSAAMLIVSDAITSRGIVTTKIAVDTINNALDCTSAINHVATRMIAEASLKRRKYVSMRIHMLYAADSLMPE